MLLARNRGRGGPLRQIHGNARRRALARLGRLAMMAEERLSGEALTRMLARTIEVVIQLRFEPLTGRRRVSSIFEVTGLEGDVISGQELWMLDSARDRLSWTGIQPRSLDKMRAKGVAYALPPTSPEEADTM